MASSKNDANQIEILPGYKADVETPASNADMCTVLYGYGRVAPTQVYYIDDYKFVGGVGRNIPRSIANAWKRGVRPDGKPAISRVYPQAILPADAREADFATATGIVPMQPAELAAMIKATDARELVEALGRQQAAALIDELKSNIGSIA